MVPAMGWALRPRIVMMLVTWRTATKTVQIQIQIIDMLIMFPGMSLSLRHIVQVLRENLMLHAAAMRHPD